MITVIIPFFNAESCLKKAVNSVLTQSYEDWELILINDCSLDNSLNIANEFAKKSHKVQVISNNRNIGVDKSRFKGLASANGEFLMFVDADDWLSVNALKVLKNKIDLENADIVFGGVVKVLDRYGLFRSKVNNSYQGLLSSCITQPELFDKYFLSYFGVNYLSVSVWGKLYRTSLIKKSDFLPTEMKMGEDLLFNMYLHPYLKKISFIQDVVYYYRFGGMTSTSNPYFLDNIKKQYYLKKQFIEKFSYHKAEEFINYELVNCFFTHFENLILLDNYNNEKLYEVLQVELEDEIYKNVINLDKSERQKILATMNILLISKKIFEDVKRRKLKHNLKKVISHLLN